MKGAERICISCAVALVVFVSCAQPKNEVSLAGTEWGLGSLGGEPLLEDTTVTLRFDDESFNGYSGCNWYGGDYTVSGSTVNFADIARTDMACAAPAGVMEQEETYGRALYQTATYCVTGDRLELLDSTGTVTLSFTRGAEMPEP